MAVAIKGLDCPTCGAPVDLDAGSCRYCMQRFIVPLAAPTPRPPVTLPPYRPPGARPRVPVTTRSKLVAILLALFLGLFGVHRFYLGRWRSGCLYLLFSWTGLPGVLALIEIVYLLCLTDQEFSRRYPTS